MSTKRGDYVRWEVLVRLNGGKYGGRARYLTRAKLTSPEKAVKLH
jgi:hypothetical protein